MEGVKEVCFCMCLIGVNICRCVSTMDDSYVKEGVVIDSLERVISKPCEIFMDKHIFFCIDVCITEFWDISHHVPVETCVKGGFPCGVFFNIKVDAIFDDDCFRVWATV